MNCPHCQKELPENHEPGSCPACGGDLSGNTMASLLGKIIKAFFFAMLILVGLVLLLLAVLYAGCVCSGGGKL